MEKLKNYTKEIILFLLTLGLYYFLKDAGSKKYVILLAAAAVFGIYGIKNFKKEYLIFGLPSAVYLFFGLLAAVCTGNYSFQIVKEAAFAMIPLLAAICFFMAAKKLRIDFIKDQFWAMILVTLPWIKYYYIEDIFESQYAFAIGVFLLYFCIVKKNLKYILLMTLAMYFMNKRIAMLAMVLILLAYEAFLWMEHKKPEWKKKIPQAVAAAGILLSLSYVVFLCAVNLEGQFLQDLTSGRSVAWAAVKAEYGLSVLWFGKGIGDVVNLLGRLQIPNYTTNLHNDLLKVFIETGLVGYVFWLSSHFAVCYWISKKQGLGFRRMIFLYLVMAYTLLNYMTDNIMVYVNYWFPVYFTLLTAIFSDEQEAQEEEIDPKKECRLLLGVIFVIGICLLGNLVYVYLDYRNPSEFTIPEDAAEIYSPQGITRFSVWTREGQPYYRVRHGGETLIEPSILGVETDGQVLEKDVTITEILYQDVVEAEEAQKDLRDPLKDAYQPVLIRMQREDLCVDLEIRVYDYGAAFRYVLPEDTQSYTELTQIRFAEYSTITGYDQTSENELEAVSTEKMDDICFSMPITASFDTGDALQIFETQTDAQVSNLTKTKWKRRTLSLRYSSDTGSTPWRTFEIEQ